MIDGLKGKPVSLREILGLSLREKSNFSEGLIGGTVELKRRTNNSRANDKMAACIGGSQIRLMTVKIFYSCYANQTHSHTKVEKLNRHVSGLSPGRCHTTPSKE